METVPEMEAVPEVEAGPEAGANQGRRARRVARSRRQRRMVAALLAVVGASAAMAALTFKPDNDSPTSTRTAGSTAEPAGDVVTSGTDAKPPSTAPGGVGTNPEKTGLPARPAEGGEVRTGTAEEGCFDNVREYLEQWDRTGVEPDPCFTAQPASNQDQPDGVQRTYNGEKF